MLPFTDYPRSPNFAYRGIDPNPFRRRRFNALSNRAASAKTLPTDTIVWHNLPTGIYHFKGEHWYGKTKNGSFVCEQAAERRQATGRRGTGSSLKAHRARSNNCGLDRQMRLWRIPARREISDRLVAS
jgi:hypothetical protein